MKYTWFTKGLKAIPNRFIGLFELKKLKYTFKIHFIYGLPGTLLLLIFEKPIFVHLRFCQSLDQILLIEV